MPYSVGHTDQPQNIMEGETQGCKHQEAGTIGDHFGGQLLHVRQKKRNNSQILEIGYMKVDLQELSLSGVQLDPDLSRMVVTKEGAKQ